MDSRRHFPLAFIFSPRGVLVLFHHSSHSPRVEGISFPPVIYRVVVLSHFEVGVALAAVAAAYEFYGYGLMGGAGLVGPPYQRPLV